MSLLSYNEIVKLLDAGVVEGFDPDAINGASLDIHLGRTILVELHEPTPRSVSYQDRQALGMSAHVFDQELQEVYLLQPGEFILTHTREVFHLPDDIAIEYKLKSSMARMGINHMLAGWGDPGWHGSALTLEFHNVSRYHAVELREGDPIGQVVFWRCEPVPEDRSYAARGRYNGDGQRVQQARQKRGSMP